MDMFYIIFVTLYNFFQAHWQWIFKGANGIEKKDKAKLLQMMRRLLYTQTEEDFNVALCDMQEDSTYLKYPNYQNHMAEKVLPRRDEWSTLHRVQAQLPTNNVNCSNYCESSFRITKDLKFSRHRAYNLVELLSIECDGSEYYSQRCIDIASNRLTSRLVNQKSRFLGPGSALARKKVNIDVNLIQKEDDGTFSVPSETKADVSYSVDMEPRICSCPHGRLKGPCKHRKLVSITQNIPSFDLIPESSPQMRQMWMYLGTGEETHINYFLPLSDPAVDGPNDEANENIIQNEGPDLIHEPYEAMETGEEETFGQNEAVITQERVDANFLRLESILGKMRDLYRNRIPSDPEGYEKALSVFENHIDRLPKSSDAILQKAACTFAQSAISPLRVHKRKKGSIIPVQVKSSH